MNDKPSNDKPSNDRLTNELIIVSEKGKTGLDIFFNVLLFLIYVATLVGNIEPALFGSAKLMNFVFTLIYVSYWVFLISYYYQKKNLKKCKMFLIFWTIALATITLLILAVAISEAIYNKNHQSFDTSFFAIISGPFIIQLLGVSFIFKGAYSSIISAAVLAAIVFSLVLVLSSRLKKNLAGVSGEGASSSENLTGVDVEGEISTVNQSDAIDEASVSIDEATAPHKTDNTPIVDIEADKKKRKRTIILFTIFGLVYFASYIYNYNHYEVSQLGLIITLLYAAYSLFLYCFFTSRREKAKSNFIAIWWIVTLFACLLRFMIYLFHFSLGGGNYIGLALQVVVIFLEMLLITPLRGLDFIFGIDNFQLYYLALIILALIVVLMMIIVRIVFSAKDKKK